VKLAHTPGGYLFSQFLLELEASKVEKQFASRIAAQVREHSS
jgi:hypothetical protein